MKKPVYLDYNASTPIHPEVAEFMKPLLDGYFGNPSSFYSYGTDSRKIVGEARENVASLLGCKSTEIIFTSGGSESNNLAIKGAAFANRHKGNHIITTAIEHPAVAEVCWYLEKQGFTVTCLPVDSSGMVSPEDVEAAITPSTILVTVMHSNNETGVIQPINEIARITRKHGVLFHTDAAQSVGKIPVTTAGIDLLSVAGHKFYAPKGVGALFIREGVTLEKLIHGADHEQNLRAGTENVLEIAGLGKAAEIAKRDAEIIRKELKALRDLIENRLLLEIPGSRVNGHPEKRLPNTLNIFLPGVESALLLPEISGEVAISAGAACHAAGMTASAVLTAMGIPEDQSRCSIRISTGRFLTMDEADKAVDVLVAAAKRIRGEKQFPVIGEEKIRLTSFTQGLGCACKLQPGMLENLLKVIPQEYNDKVMVGIHSSDDAAVYRISPDTAIVQTLDFFTPVVDDPYDFGAIAAANSLSDIYAMGASPIFALNIVAFPSSRLPESVLGEILKGAADKAAEAGIPILGGHSIDDPDPKFGMAVTGIVHPEIVLRNDTARPGDVLILTKPLGTGILATALKRGMLPEEHIKELVECMKELNMKAAAIMKDYEIHACTDITGFGLLGHLYEMTSGSKVEAIVSAASVPLLTQAEKMASAGIVPGGTKNNMAHFGRYVDFAGNVSEILKILLFDSQTSGGLLIAVSPEQADGLHTKLCDNGVKASMIGSVTGRGEGRIRVD